MTDFFKSFKAWIPKDISSQTTLDFDETIFSSKKDYLIKTPENNKKNFIEDQTSSYYIYELRDPCGITKIGITAVIDINTYKNKLIKCENIIEDVIYNKTISFETFQLQLSPITLACQKNENLFSFLEDISKKLSPTISTNYNGTLNTIWGISHPFLKQKIDNMLNEIDFFYIMDGHHRIESLLRLNNKTKIKRYLMACIFPLGSIKVDPLHRMISLKGNDAYLAQHVLTMLKKKFKITTLNEDIYLPINNQIGLSLFGIWYKIECNYILGEDTEVSLLHNYILPMINDYFDDHQIQYLSNEDLVENIKSKEIIFTLPVPKMENLFPNNSNNKEKKYIQKIVRCMPKPLTCLLVYNQKEHF